MTAKRLQQVFDGEASSEYEKLQLRCWEVAVLTGTFDVVVCVIGDVRQRPGVVHCLFEEFNRLGVSVRVGGKAVQLINTSKIIHIRSAFELANDPHTKWVYGPNSYGVVDFRIEPDPQYPWWDVSGPEPIV